MNFIRHSIRTACALLIAPLLFACAHAISGAAPVSSAIMSTNSEKKAEPGTFPLSWYAGSTEHASRPDFQVHAYNEDFFILRQAAFTNYEKPFLYLIFGRDKAILFDTGAGKADVAGAVESVMKVWLKAHKRVSIPLIVAHSHAHGDHVAGDAQFSNRAGITLVGKDTAAVRAFFSIQHWPTDMVTYDLGDRVLDILPIPGHEASSIAVYDRRTHILLTGDAFYPGRLYVRDGNAFTTSIQRLVDFSATHNVAHFLGTHIEQSNTPFKDYVVGTVDQPNEHVLELTHADLLEMNAALKAMDGNVTRKAFAGLTIWPNTR